MKQHIEDFLKFLESRDNKKIPLRAKLLHPYKFSPITKEDLTVKGDLNLAYTKIRYLPDNLTVEGDLDLAYAKIESIPDNLTVGGNFYLMESDVQRDDIQPIPINLKVGGSLYLWDTDLGSTMTSKRIRQKIENKGGYVKGNINR